MAVKFYLCSERRQDIAHGFRYQNVKINANKSRSQLSLHFQEGVPPHQGNAQAGRAGGKSVSVRPKSQKGSTLRQAKIGRNQSHLQRTCYLESIVWVEAAHRHLHHQLWHEADIRLITHGGPQARQTEKMMCNMMIIGIGLNYCQAPI